MIAAQTQRALIPIILFSLAWIFFSYLSMRDNAIGLLSDSYIYLLLADYFSPFRTFDQKFAEYLLAGYSYPPGFPILLGMLGGGADNLRANFYIDAGFLAAAGVAFYVWLTRQDIGKRVAILLAVGFFLLPVSLISSLGIFSEHPYMLAIIAAAILLTKDRPSTVKLYGAALIIGIAVLIRSVGIAAILAFILVVLLHTLRGRFAARIGAISVAIVLLPSICWSLVKIYKAYDQSYANSVVRGTVGETLDGIIAQVPINLRALWQHFIQLFGANDHLAQIICAALLCIILIGWLARLRRANFDAIYVLAYLSIILAWPYPNHFGRFLFAILPFLIFYGFDGTRLVLSQLLTSASNKTRDLLAGTCLSAMIIVLAAPTSAQIVKEIVTPEKADLAMLVRTPNWHLLKPASRESKVLALEKMLDSLTKARRLTPKNACISSSEPHYVHYFARRRSVKPPPADSANSRFSAALAACPFVFMMSVASYPPSEFPIMYPFYRIEKEMRVLDVAFFGTDTKRGTVRSMLAATGKARNYQPD